VFLGVFPKVVGCNYGPHLFIFTSRFSSFYFEGIANFFNIVYRGKKARVKVFYVGGKLGRRWDLLSSPPPFLLGLLFANIELWPFFYEGYLTLQ
jgi:hypothetical protein